MKKSIRKYAATMLATALFLFAGSCIKDDLQDMPYLYAGKIAVTADWTRRGEGVDIPALWRMSIGDYAGEETGMTHVPGRSFDPGSYTLVSHSPARGITVDGTMAMADTAGGSKDDDGMVVTGVPGWFFTNVQDVDIEAGRNNEFTAVMRQQVRELTLMIEPVGGAADRIKAIEGFLGGVAGSLDFATDTHGTPSDVELHFTKRTEGDEAGKWTVTVRLLGTAGDVQTLTAMLAYTDTSLQPTILESDLTAAMDGFNEDKTIPLVLGGALVETPEDAGMTATIEDWNTVTGGPVEAM